MSPISDVEWRTSGRTGRAHAFLPSSPNAICGKTSLKLEGSRWGLRKEDDLICKNCEKLMKGEPNFSLNPDSEHCCHARDCTVRMPPEKLTKKSLQQKFWERVEKTETCWLWTGPFNMERGRYGVFNGTRTPIWAHRFAWEVQNGPIPKGKILCHRCDVPKCVRPEHLFLGTKADNAQDAASKGRTAAGERSSSSKLSLGEIETIRSLLQAGVPQREIAERFNVNQSTISDVQTGISWKPERLGHECHARECSTSVPPEKLLCLKHWRMVPALLQREIWLHYRPGQCDDKDVTMEWLRAADAAIGHVAIQEGRVFTLVERDAMMHFGLFQLTNLQ